MNHLTTAFRGLLLQKNSGGIFYAFPSSLFLYFAGKKRSDNRVAASDAFQRAWFPKKLYIFDKLLQNMQGKRIYLRFRLLFFFLNLKIEKPFI